MADVASLEVLDTKLDAVLLRLSELCERQEDYEQRLREVELDSARHTERLSLVAAGLAALQLIGSGVAVAIGAWLK